MRQNINTYIYNHYKEKNKEIDVNPNIKRMERKRRI